MSNEVDILMDLDPIELTKNPAQLDAIIAHYRRSRVTPGGKRPKKETGPKAVIDLKALGLGAAPVTIKRRV